MDVGAGVGYRALGAKRLIEGNNAVNVLRRANAALAREGIIAVELGSAAEGAVSDLAHMARRRGAVILVLRPLGSLDDLIAGLREAEDAMVAGAEALLGGTAIADVATAQARMSAGGIVVTSAAAADEWAEAAE